MATTISSGFAKLRDNLEITDLQTATVSTRQQNVRTAVDRGMSVLDDFLTGSYRRNTMIAPLKGADVDVFVVLNSSHFTQHGQQQLLADTKAALRKTYRTPDISPNGQAVTIVFDDFRVDVVPAFHRKGGGYLIPDSQRAAWIATDPKLHLEIWTEHNRVHDADLVPMIKILKGWNKSRSLLRSFHLECLAVSIFANIRIDDFPSGARFFFDKARDMVKYKLPDPAGYNDDVATYISTDQQITAIADRLNWAYATALEAEQLAANFRVEAAFQRWQKIFAGYFPAYG